jgi:hypothetical protein
MTYGLAYSRWFSLWQIAYSKLTRPSKIQQTAIYTRKEYPKILPHKTIAVILSFCYNWQHLVIILGVQHDWRLYRLQGISRQRSG